MNGDGLLSRPFGSTGVRASVVGLGCGGPSRLGTRGDAGDAARSAAVEVVRAAVELGVTLIDTAESYGTQPAVAEVIRACRDDVILCTKKAAADRDADGTLRFVTPADYADGIDGCLRELGVDTIDVFYLHGITPDEYDHAAGELLPVIERARDAGKVRWIGVSEFFQGDTRHEMLTRALDDRWPEVVMVGFNPLNQSARESILPRTSAMGVATVGMFAVRRALSDPERLRAIVAELLERGELEPGRVDPADPLGFVGDRRAVIDAAYRYCAHEPGIDCMLVGTGSLSHLRENLESVRRGSLPSDLHERLSEAFRGIDSVTGH